MYFGHWEPLGVSESCRTRIPGWANPRVNWTDAVAFRCTWEHLGAPATSLGAPTTSLGAPGSASDKPGSANHKPGSANHKPGSTSNHCRAVWENIIFFGNTVVRLEIIATAYCLKLMYSVCILIYASMYLYSYPSTHSISGLAASCA